MHPQHVVSFDHRLDSLGEAVTQLRELGLQVDQVHRFLGTALVRGSEPQLAAARNLDTVVGVVPAGQVSAAG